ncbi:MAG: glycosyltransferase [Conexibacter sp.]|nr:glycosyltransferase [Conexibacter sp.]
MNSPSLSACGRPAWRNVRLVLTLVTVCDADNAPEALVLAESFLAHHPDGRVLAVVADAASPPAFGGHERVEVRTGRELVGPKYELLAAGLSGVGLAQALLPAALEAAPLPAIAMAPGAEVLAPISLGASDGVLVTATGAAEAGVVDDGMVAVTGPGAVEVLTWWNASAASYDVEELVAEAATRFAQVTVVRDPRWAVAAWNAEDRGVTSAADGRLVLPDGSPVTWARLGGHGVAAGPLAAAARDHVQRVAAAEFALGPMTLESLLLPGGTPLDDRLQRLFVDGVRDGALTGAPFDAAGFAAFQRWLDEPDPVPEAGGVSRYLFRFWHDRPDLRRAYADLRDAEQRQGFTGWINAYARSEIPDWLLPEPITDLTTPRAEVAPIAVNVAGYLQSELGVGEAARRVIGALDAAHVPLLPVQTQVVPSGGHGLAYSVVRPTLAPFLFNLVCVNADGLDAFAEEVGEAFFAGRHTVGMWWWELPTFPSNATRSFDHLDELWVGSSFVLEAIAPVAPIPVIKVPLAVERTQPPRRTRAQLGLPEGFLILFFFDHNSVLERKNPLGLIEAFRRAFPEGDGAHLVIKSVHGELHPRDRLRLRVAAEAHPDVTLIEGHLSVGDRDAMVASCDLYASLHRSEGFGLTLAEAMALERPVLATAWSGNLEFMHPETTWLVPAELVPVGQGNGPYDALSHWADPDLEAAAAAMRAVRADPDAAAAKATAAAKRLLHDHDPARVGTIMRERLSTLAPRVADARRSAEPSRPPVAATTTAVTAAVNRVQVGAAAYAPSRSSAVARRARAALLRAPRPVTENQRAIDEAILCATQALSSEVQQLRACVDVEVLAHAELSAATLASQRTLLRRVAELEQVASNDCERMETEGGAR